MRAELFANGAPDTVVDDAVLVLSELLSNSCRHARPLRDDASVRASWSQDAEGGLTISVTDGGGPTRPLPATPSITAHGGRGLAIIGALARDWGVDAELGELPDDADGSEPDKSVTVWVLLTAHTGPGAGDRLTVGSGTGAGSEAVSGNGPGSSSTGGRPRGHHRRGRRPVSGGSRGTGGAPDRVSSTDRSGDAFAEGLAFDLAAVEELR